MIFEEITALAAREYFEHPEKYSNPYQQNSPEFDAYERGWMQALKRDDAREIGKPSFPAAPKLSVNLYEQAKGRSKPQ